MSRVVYSGPRAKKVQDQYVLTVERESGDMIGPLKEALAGALANPPAEVAKDAD